MAGTRSCYVAVALVLTGVPRAGAIDYSEAVAQASAVVRDAHWDPASFARVNLIGGSSTFGVVIGYVADGFVVALVNDDLKAKHKPLLLKFGTGQTQDSLCAAPVHVEVEKLSCGAQALDDLPGCHLSTKSQELVLSGGDCDPITIYWDHQRRLPTWWRN
jgi:hypothetical protein